MKRLNLVAVVLLFAGCARFVTKQTDRSYLCEHGTEIREITTKVTATTFFESHSALANFKALQTDKTQSASVGSLNQEASATNLVKIIEVSAELGAKMALRSMGIPAR